MDLVSSGQLRCLSCRQTRQNMSTLSRDNLETIIRPVMDTFPLMHKNPTKPVHPVTGQAGHLYWVRRPHNAVQLAVLCPDKLSCVFCTLFTVCTFYGNK